MTACPSHRILTVLLAIPLLVGGVSWTMAVEAGGHEAAPSASPTRIAELIGQLGNADYFVRERAQAELGELGFQAYEALSEASHHEDLEIAARVRWLLRKMDVAWVRPDDPPMVQALLEGYDLLDEESRLAKIHAVAGLPGGEGAVVLTRMVRFEPSSRLSKSAALAAIRALVESEQAGTETFEQVDRELVGSRRLGTAWVRAALERRADPAALAEHFGRLIEEERARLTAGDGATSPRIVTGLMRLQAEWLAALGRRGEAVALMRQSLELQSDRPERLRELMSWLIEQQAWEVAEQVSERFAEPVQTDPALLYLLAEARQGAGREEQAEETANEAFSLRPGPRPAWLWQRQQLAVDLLRRDRLSWSRREFDYVVRHAARVDPEMLFAWERYAELLNDHGAHLAAAEVLKQMLAAFERTPNWQDDFRDQLKPFEARMHYFRARHHCKQGETQKEREAIEQALTAYPEELDTLIAYYRLSKGSPADRKRARQLIETAAAALEKQIALRPDTPDAYNQYAWLIGNTEGDLDRALRYSRRSIQLRPDTAAYLDTLAHVHYAKGEYREAVEFQTRAAELQPDSKAIADQLKVFSDALEHQP